MILATTFNERGYNAYGKRWIESVSKFWPKETVVNLYLDFKISNLPENFKVITFSDTFPDHKDFIDRINFKFKNQTSNSKLARIADKTIKFSYKAFVISEELKNDKGEFVWLDGDVETLTPINFKDIANILGTKFLACQKEKQEYQYSHIESGILLFNLEHSDTNKFLKSFEEYYHTEKIFSLKKPYDGYVIGKILKEKSFDFYDFNENFTVIGKTSSKDETFLHPFLKERFIHWIGTDKRRFF
jgi:hypothetical protein